MTQVTHSVAGERRVEFRLQTLSQVHLADSTPEPIPKAPSSREPTLIPESHSSLPCMPVRGPQGVIGQESMELGNSPPPPTYWQSLTPALAVRVWDSC